MQERTQSQPAVVLPRYEDLPEVATQLDIRGSRDAVGAPELAVHRGLRGIECERTDRARCCLGGGNHDVVEPVGACAECIDFVGSRDVERCEARAGWVNAP